jgi:hypothetical protein
MGASVNNGSVITVWSIRQVDMHSEPIGNIPGATDAEMDKAMTISPALIQQSIRGHQKGQRAVQCVHRVAGRWTTDSTETELREAAPVNSHRKVRTSPRGMLSQDFAWV